MVVKEFEINANVSFRDNRWRSKVSLVPIHEDFADPSYWKVDTEGIGCTPEEAITDGIRQARAEWDVPLEWNDFR